jgi:hypothetical protein
VRNYKIALVMTWALVAVGLAADSNPLAGAWKGTWDGGSGGGGFDMNFAVSSDGKLGGTVAVTTGMGNYNAAFSTATFVGGKLTAAYDYPPDLQGEVTLAGSFDAKAGSGTWSLAAKGQPAQSMAGGTWKVAR